MAIGRSHRRVATGLLAGVLLLGPLAGCGSDSEPADADASPATTESSPAEDTGAATETSEPEDTGESTGSPGTDGDTQADVDCSGTSCSLTLTGGGAEAEILGTQVALSAVESGRATVRVGEEEISCSEGESVSAGPLTLECTSVTEDAVTMTASLG